MNIIDTLDEYMLRTGKESLTAIEAGEILAKKGILKEQSIKGYNLRKKLRNGEKPHAYQVKGKYSKWVIPISPQRKGNE